MSIISGLFGLNMLVMLSGFITAPLQARALGPAGRGDLAAVLVVSGLIPIIADFGFYTFAAREAARGTARSSILGATLPTVLTIGTGLACASPFVSAWIAGDRETVRVYLLLVLALAPATLAGTIAAGIVWGEQRWRVYTALRLLPVLGNALVIATLFLLGHLTLATAASATVATSAATSIVALIGLRRIRAQAERELRRTARKFGSQAWLADLANAGNARLDQLLMTRLVVPAELGLYTSAVTLGSLQQAFTNAVVGVIFPRVSHGDAEPGLRALRLTAAASSLVAAGAALLAPELLSLVFGKAFQPAATMARVLAVASIPAAISYVGASVLVGLGAVHVPARAELLSLAITIPGLLLVLPKLGGEGAAVVSLAAYTVTCVYLLGKLRVQLAIRWHQMLWPSRGDRRYVLSQARRALRR